MISTARKHTKAIWRDRITVSKGPFGMSIAQTCFVIVTIIAILFSIIWVLEHYVLPPIIGFNIPLFFKVLSAVSTALLFIVLRNDVDLAYLVLCSCFFYVASHTIILGALIQAFIDREKTLELRSYLKFPKGRDEYFYLFVALSILRILLSWAFSYYVLILAVIRLEGGNGWECKNALDLEIESMPNRIDQQVVRLRERKIIREILGCNLQESPNMNTANGQIE